MDETPILNVAWNRGQPDKGKSPTKKLEWFLFVVVLVSFVFVLCYCIRFFWGVHGGDPIDPARILQKLRAAKKLKINYRLGSRKEGMVRKEITVTDPAGVQRVLDALEIDHVQALEGGGEENPRVAVTFWIKKGEEFEMVGLGPAHMEQKDRWFITFRNENFFKAICEIIAGDEETPFAVGDNDLIWGNVFAGILKTATKVRIMQKENGHTNEAEIEDKGQIFELLAHFDFEQFGNQYPPRASERSLAPSLALYFQLRRGITEIRFLEPKKLEVKEPYYPPKARIYFTLKDAKFYEKVLELLKKAEKKKPAP